MDDALRVPAGDGLGRRIRAARLRAGMSRQVAANLVGRSEEWLKKVERGERGTTIRNVTALARVLKVRDLADLLGEHIPTGAYARPRHDGLDRLRTALSDYPPDDGDAANLGDLRRRVDAAWYRHSDSPRNREITAQIAPGLLAEARRAARAASTPTERRDALAVLSTAYLLAQLYLAYQGVPELICVASDRAIATAWESDDPGAIGQATWLRAFLARDLGEISTALRLTEDARRRLDRDDASPRQRSLPWLADALTYARDGTGPDAWRCWDQAVDIDPDDDPLALYSSQPSAVALILDVELGRSRSAMGRAQRLDVTIIPTATKRASALLAAARAHALAGEWTGVLHLLRGAVEQSPDQVVYSAHAGQLVVDLVERGGPLLERDARQLAADLGIAA